MGSFQYVARRWLYSSFRDPHFTDVLHSWCFTYLRVWHLTNIRCPKCSVGMVAGTRFSMPSSFWQKKPQQYSQRLFICFVLLVVSSYVETNSTGRAGIQSVAFPCIPCVSGVKARLHMRFLMRFLMRFRVQNAPYPTLHECFFREASCGLERKLSHIVSRHPSFQFLLTWWYFVAALRD